MNSNRYVTGFILIAVGLFFLLNTFGVINYAWGTLWPMFLFIPALAFHAAFFLSGAKKRNAGLLVPGGILLVLSLLFFFEMATSWRFAGDTWPFYLFAVAFGLFELWLFGGRQAGLLIPVFILTGVGSVFFFENLLSYPIFNMWPVILIVVGLVVIFGNKNNQHNKAE